MSVHAPGWAPTVPEYSTSRGVLPAVTVTRHAEAIRSYAQSAAESSALVILIARQDGHAQWADTITRARDELLRVIARGPDV